MVLSARGDLIRSIRAGIGNRMWEIESSERSTVSRSLLQSAGTLVYQGLSEEPSGTFPQEGIYPIFPWVIVYGLSSAFWTAWLGRLNKILQGLRESPHL